MIMFIYINIEFKKPVLTAEQLHKFNIIGNRTLVNYDRRLPWSKSLQLGTRLGGVMNGEVPDISLPLFGVSSGVVNSPEVIHQVRIDLRMVELLFATHTISLESSSLINPCSWISVIGINPPQIFILPNYYKHNKQ